jgi:outer membrane protein, adhesin transport system
MKKLALPLIGLIAMACQPSWAQSSGSLKDSAQRAITANPEVVARLNAFRAAGEDSRAARAGFLPRVDLGAGAELISQRNTTANQSFSSTGVTLSATQLLWDGLATQGQANRFDHARLVRYFEFLDFSEQTALEAVRAHADVVRARGLVKLAEDNYVNHRVFAEQIQARVKAGFDRASDLEQATARQALAESNLITETANLHDVSERYRRLTGEAAPAAISDADVLGTNLPRTVPTLLDQSIRRHAAIAAAVENLRAAQAQSQERDAAMQPRIEARVRGGLGNNLDGVLNQKREARAGVYLNWNLYNGGADQSRIRQAVNLLAQATDTRDKVCRDVRQTASIAFNDVRKLDEQLGSLDINAKSTLKARDAYREQFNIGRRSLLDLLNTENDLYSARRAFVNAESDLVVAKARTHAASGNLVAVLGLTRAGGLSDIANEAVNWQAGADGVSRCPLEPTELALPSRADLEERVRQAQGVLPALPAASTPVPRPSATPSAAPLLEETPARATPTPPPSTPVSQRLLDWVDSWSTKDVTRYVSFYSPQFKPAGVSRDRWFANRTALLKKAGPIELKISNVQRRSVSADLVETRFDQVYTSPNFKDRTQKTLLWRRSGTEWYIVKESNR